jgi:RHS repeat-associated protein
VRANSNGEAFSYFPYGEERTSTADGREKFGTYTRDMPGQDYAMQRYYSGSTGAFWTPDPGGIKTAKPSNPASWNRYARTNGDPVNFGDPTGRIVVSCDDPDAQSIYDASCEMVGDGEDGGGGGGSNSCGGNAFDPTPDPSCYSYVPPPPPPALLAMECEATLYTRPVDNPIAVPFGGTHSYWGIEEYDPNTGSDVFNVVISAGPNNVQGTLKHGPATYLNIWVHSPYQGVDTASAATSSWSTGLSAANCPGVNTMLDAAETWPNNKIPYGGPLFPNSNTVAHILGNLGGFSPPAPPGSWGWNYPF